MELGRRHRFRQRRGQGAVLPAPGVDRRIAQESRLEEAESAAEYVKGTILSQAGFPGIDVAFRESEVTLWSWPEAPLLRSPPQPRPQVPKALHGHTWPPHRPARHALL